tara:strand:- start:170 stop:1156 length:987 start_codon:yes stop_codon:yes gene_type:complete
MSQQYKYTLYSKNNYNIDTSSVSDSTVVDFEKEVADYVGAKYAVSAINYSCILQIILMGIRQNLPEEACKIYPVCLPSMISPGIANIIHNSGMPAMWIDKTDHIGDSLVIYDSAGAIFRIKKDYSSFRFIDSTHKIERNQFKQDCDDTDVIVYSMYPNTPMWGIDGGVLVTSDKEKADYFRTAFNFGAETKKDSRELVFPGWQMHASAEQCYVGLQNLRAMDDRNKKMASILEKYNSAFGIKNTSFSIYAIDVDPNRRKEIRLALAEKGIQSGVHYAPAHYYPFYRMAIPNRMPKTEEKCASTLSIPFNPSLEEADLDFIIQSIKDLS